MKSKLTNILTLTLMAGTTLICNESLAGLVLGNGNARGYVDGTFIYAPTGIYTPDLVSYEYHGEDFWNFNLLDEPFSEATFAEAESPDRNASLAGRASAHMSFTSVGDTSTFNGGVLASILALAGNESNTLPNGVGSLARISYGFTLDTSHSFSMDLFDETSGAVGDKFNVWLSNQSTGQAICSNQNNIADSDFPACDSLTGILNPGNYYIHATTITSDLGYSPLTFPSQNHGVNLSLALVDLSEDSGTIPAPASILLMLGGLTLLRLNNRRSV